METGPLAELGRTILADLARTSLTNALVSRTGVNASRKRRTKSIAPIGEDLPAYLRSIHRWLITKEVAAILHCHTETIYRRLHHEGFPAHRDGRRWKYDPSEIADWIEQRHAAFSSHLPQT